MKTTKTSKTESLRVALNLTKQRMMMMKTAMTQKQRRKLPRVRGRERLKTQQIRKQRSLENNYYCVHFNVSKFSIERMIAQQQKLFVLGLRMLEYRFILVSFFDHISIPVKVTIFFFLNEKERKRCPSFYYLYTYYLNSSGKCKCIQELINKCMVFTASFGTRVPRKVEHYTKIIIETVNIIKDTTAEYRIVGIYSTVVHYQIDFTPQWTKKKTWKKMMMMPQGRRTWP